MAKEVIENFEASNRTEKAIKEAFDSDLYKELGRFEKLLIFIYFRIFSG